MGKRLLRHLDRQDSTYIARPYTDGSYYPSIQQYFSPDDRLATATAAIIIKDDTSEWKSKPVLAIYMDKGEDLGIDAAYTMEFIALAASLQATVFSGGRLHATGSDAQAVLKLIPGRKQRLQQVMKDHHFLLQCIDNYLFQGAPIPFKVPSHAERDKKQRDNQGRLGVGWTKDEWGNWIADRIAAQDLSAIRREGIRLQMLTVSVTTVYNELRTAGQWYIGDKCGHPVSPQGVYKIIHKNLHKQYLRERDEYRKERGAAPIWEFDSSMSHSAQVYELRRAPPNIVSTKVRTIYDKGYHGGNRAKNTTLTEEQLEETRQCRLCNNPDSQNHWLHECDHGPLRTLRLNILGELN